MTDSIANLRRRANKEDQALLDELASARTQYSVQSLRGPGKAGIEQHQTNLKTLEQQIETLENQVSSRSAEFRTQSKPITLDAVQQAIPANAVLVEFASYRQYDAKNKPGSRHYAVYVLTNNGEPLFAELGEADAIEKAITTLRAYLPNGKSNIEKEIKPAARALDELVMRPVRKLIGDKKLLLIAPDGALNLIPFDALVDENGKYLVESYEISYLTSGRDLLRLQNGITSKQSPMIIADPDFADGPGPQLGDQAFNPLPRLKATADEANQIKTELDGATVLMRQQATKQALESVNRPAILHIATHGFFLSNESGNQTEEQRIAVRVKLEQGESAGVKLENPLLRSGLFFAGANAKGEAGTLTALEATGLDLWGTKLVVLSACDTGVGEVKNGDGVYGLRRALVLAGSESQMMSLWPVSDEGTRELMVGYYEALKAKEGRSAGLRAVRLAMLKNPARSHPFYWASFILSGEWANLDGKR
jgi:CHAT domain-containing protein